MASSIVFNSSLSPSPFHCCRRRRFNVHSIIEWHANWRWWSSSRLLATGWLTDWVPLWHLHGHGVAIVWQSPSIALIWFGDLCVLPGSPQLERILATDNDNVQYCWHEPSSSSPPPPSSHHDYIESIEEREGRTRAIEWILSLSIVSLWWSIGQAVAAQNGP